MTTLTQVPTPADLTAGLSVQHAIDAAPTFVVDDAGDLQIAAELITQLSTARKEIEVQRLALVKPVKALTAKIDAAARERRDPIEAAERQLKGAVATYADAQRAAASAERLRLEERAVANIAASSTMRPVVIDPGTLPQVVEGRTATSSGSIGTRLVWDFEIFDMQEVPRDYLVLHVSGVRDAVREGVRAIPGIRIFERTQVDAR